MVAVVSLPIGEEVIKRLHGVDVARLADLECDAERLRHLSSGCGEDAGRRSTDPW